MPYFHVKAKDKAGALSVRLETREAHLGWIKGKLDQVKLAGPMLNETTGDMEGSILIIEAPSKADLEVLLTEDPYAQAGLFESVEITLFKWAIGAP